MFNLIKNELFKMFAAKKIYAFMGIIFAAVLIPSLVESFLGVDLQLTGQNLPFVQLTPLVEFLIPVFLIILAVDMFTEEYAGGTLGVLLTQPVTRIKLLNAKIVSLAIIILFLLFFSLGASYLTGTIFFGLEDPLVIGDVTYSTAEGMAFTLLLHIISALPLTAFAVIMALIALNFTSSGAAIGVGLGIYFTFTMIHQVAEIARPFLINTHFNLYELVFNGSGKEWLLSMSVIAAYGIFSYLLAVCIMKKKDILM